MYALDAATGAKLWSFATGGAIDSSPAVAGGTVYIGSNDDSVYALDAATGAKQWSFATGNLVQSSPAVSGGRVYVSSTDGNLYALSTSDGTKLWSFATGGGRSSPAVAGGTVYVGGDDHDVYALDAATGTKQWSFATSGAVDSSPAVADGVIYVGGNDGHIRALDAATGTRLDLARHHRRPHRLRAGRGQRDGLHQLPRGQPVRLRPGLGGEATITRPDLSRNPAQPRAAPEERPSRPPLTQDTTGLWCTTAPKCLHCQRESPSSPDKTCTPSRRPQGRVPG